MAELDLMLEVSFTHGRRTGQCFVCGKADANACSGCFVDFYCGREHQTQDWPRHKQGCGCFEVHSDPRMGRHLVATKDVPAGTIIMRELPLVTFPKQSKEHPVRIKPVCVGCCEVLPQPPGDPDGAGECERCGWPVCGEACSDREEHRAECAAFQRANFKLLGGGTRLQWSALIMLRLALAAQEPTLQARLQLLQHKLPALDEDTVNALPPSTYFEVLRKRSQWEDDRRKAAEWLTQEAGLDWLDPKELQRWAAVVDINSLDLDVPSKAVQGLFAGASTPEHSCVPNVAVAAWAEDVDAHGRGLVGAALEHVVYSSRRIARGEHLSVSHLGAAPEAGKEARQAELITSRRSFYCQCALCLDPEEGGLRLAAWFCGPCKANGSQRLVQLDAHGALYSCNGCGRDGVVHLVKDQPPGTPQVGELKYRVKDMIKDHVSGVKKVLLVDWERFVAEALWPRGPLHATSQAVLQAKRRMLHYEPLERESSVETLAEVERLARYCRDAVSAVETLWPDGHVEFGGPLKRRLATLICYQLHMLNAVLYADPGAWPRLKDDVHALRRESGQLYSQLQQTAVTPADKMLVESMINGMKDLFERFFSVQ